MMKVAYHIESSLNPALPDTIITMGNTIGNSIAGNASDKARFLARLLNMRVCVYQRPGTGSDQRLPSHKADDFLKHTQDAAAFLDDALFTKEGVHHALVTAHPADGPFAAGMVMSELLPVVGYAVSDPVGIQQVSTAEGFVRWMSYQRRQKQPGHPSPETPAEWKAPPEISSRNVAAEMRLNHRVWREPRMLHHLKYIAEHLQHVAVRAVFPQYSFNGEGRFMEITADTIHSYGTLRPDTAAPFAALYEPGRAHRFYDDPRYFGGLVVDTLTMLGHKPENFVHEMYAEPTFRHAGVLGA